METGCRRGETYFGTWVFTANFIGMLPVVTIITPCYNEGAVVTRFLGMLEQCLATQPYSFRVVVVNDHSIDDTAALLRRFTFAAANVSLNVLELTENLGHQAAILQGFQYARNLPGDRFIVIDADGEDCPAAIPTLLQEQDTDIVAVVRGRRSESSFFRLAYSIYKVLFRLATGKQMNFGNYCMLKRTVVERAATEGFLHLAAFLSKQPCDIRYIAADRRRRLGGRSKMGFARLLRHGINSIIEYRKREQPALNY